MAKPIIKWVGGKRQLLNDIKNNLPEYNNYFEPFIGGGALFFDLMPQNAIINDYNPELTNLYNVVKNNPNELIESLSQHINSEEYYYYVRNLDRMPEYKNISDIEKASRFIFLNKTGFNGLYRVNKKGQNNVPFGKQSNPTIVNSEAILEAHKALFNTTILNGDFEGIKSKIQAGDFVYFDPPYIPVNKTSNFTSYTNIGFSMEDQTRLRDFCDYINSIGAYFLLSNSHTEEVLDLYSNYVIIEVFATRALNCKGDSRGAISEVLVKNY